MGLEAELGSGQAAELDDTAYDQNLAHTGSVTAPLGSTALPSAPAQQQESRPGISAGSDAPPGDAAAALQQTDPQQSAACSQALQGSQDHGNLVVMPFNADPEQPGSHKVQVPSSVFDSHPHTEAGTHKACMPEAVKRMRGPFGSLGSRLSRLRSRTSRQLSGAPSASGQLRMALSRCVSSIPPSHANLVSTKVSHCSLFALPLVQDVCHRLCSGRPGVCKQRRRWQALWEERGQGSPRGG